MSSTLVIDTSAVGVVLSPSLPVLLVVLLLRCAMLRRGVIGVVGVDG